jgi:hypothetical protein
MQVIWGSRASTSVASAGAKVYPNEPVPRLDAGVGEQTCVEENDEHDAGIPQLDLTRVSMGDDSGGLTG